MPKQSFEKQLDAIQFMQARGKNLPTTLKAAVNVAHGTVNQPLCVTLTAQHQTIINEMHYDPNATAGGHIRPTVTGLLYRDSQSSTCQQELTTEIFRNALANGVEVIY